MHANAEVIDDNWNRVFLTNFALQLFVIQCKSKLKSIDLLVHYDTKLEQTQRKKVS